MIVDVTSWHGRASLDREPVRTPFTAITDEAPTIGRLFARAGGSLSGYALQPPARAILLTLIDALFSS